MFENRLITNGKMPNAEGEYILYWMISNRRTIDNHSLELAISLAKEHDLPLYVVEPIAVNHHYSSKRLHYFVIGGMVDNYYAFKDTPICYCSYIEKYDKEGSGVFKAWMKNAKITVTDHHPTYLPKYVGEYALEQNEHLSILVNSNRVSPVVGLIRTPPLFFVVFSSENDFAASSNVSSLSSILFLIKSILFLASINA